MDYLDLAKVSLYCLYINKRVLMYIFIYMYIQIVSSKHTLLMNLLNYLSFYEKKKQLESSKLISSQ